MEASQRKQVNDKDGISVVGRRSIFGLAASCFSTKLLVGGATLASSVRAIASETVSAAMARRKAACALRDQGSRGLSELPFPTHRAHPDLIDYPTGIYSYSKCLPHNSLGEVEPQSWQAFRAAVATGSDAQFEQLTMGSPGKLVDPNAAFAFNTEGCDSCDVSLQTPPAFGSPHAAAEVVEVYWRALLRDVPYDEFTSSELVKAACQDMSQLSGYQGPKVGGRVTPETLFRGSTAGDIAGPHISQFLLKDIPFGGTLMKQRYRTFNPGIDFMTDYNEWLAVQDGHAPSRRVSWDPTYRYIRNGRDLAAYVQRDFSYQAFLNAGLILSELGLGALSDTNPYKRARSISGFVTWGQPQMLDWLGRVTSSALKACWYHKWVLALRIRPEEFGGRIQNHLQGRAAYPIHVDLLNSAALSATYDRHEAYLLPMAFPEGCPAHPSYPAGHAAVAGACATVLKAFFDENGTLPDAAVPTADGQSIVPWNGRALTIGGEINKLASNIALGRDTAGLHYRMDGTGGLELGEAVAISILRDQLQTMPQRTATLTFTKFDGTRVTLHKQS